MSHRLLPLSLSLMLVLTPIASTLPKMIRLPDMGDASQVDFGSDEEQKLGLEIMRKLRERDLILDDAQLTEYLNSIGQSIVTYADQNGTPYVFHCP